MTLARYAGVTASLEGLEVAYTNAVAWTLDLAAALSLQWSAALAAGLRAATMDA